MPAPLPFIAIRRRIVALLSLVLLVGCDEGQVVPDSAAHDAPVSAVEPPTVSSGSGATAASTEAPVESGPRVVFVGTSLTAGYGLADPATEAWPAQVEVLAQDAGLPISMVNAGVSGDTSAGGLRRVVPLLNPAPAAVVLELGANDGLRGLPLADLRANLDAAVDSIRRYAPEADILLVRMQAPRNLGADYVTGFDAVFDSVEARAAVTPVPFILEGVAGVAALNQADGIHPIAEGHRRMAETAWGVLEELLRPPGATP